MHFLKRLYIELYVLFYNHFWSDLRIENPKVDYPILIISFVNLFLLTFVYVTEFFLIRSGIPTPNEFVYGDVFVMMSAYLMVSSPAYLTAARSAFAEQMDIGSGLVSGFIMALSLLLTYLSLKLITDYAVFMLFFIIGLTT